ncbi:FH1/FH2 domain-containing protein 3-like isoform X15 [Asterias amurensis]|uniref:FH1/FH2 domain-containing protein 3-like isoform X15 n=1 Tax=Asterias amurensis TaxID=7602 RepID=UPI003AB701DA
MAFTCRVQYLDDTDPFASTVFPEPTRPPSFTFNEYLPLIDQLPAVCKFLRAPHKLEDCTLQLSHNGYYLDIESSIDEQKDDFEGFIKERKHSVILRSQLSVRVHACIEKLLNSTGRELRRALFSLKQIFQDDKDLVHEFVSADGLACLIKVGTDADQNYQNYILRALGQIMLYVDGMNGVIEHTDTVQWLYSLLSSKYRLVVKTSLKLLLVFVEYSESNATVLYQATCVVDKEQGKQTWSNVMNLLKDEGQDSEILVYTMSLINKTLNAIPDQDTFYDITDSLEQEGIEETTKQLMSGKGTDLDLVEQFKLYEYSLKKEDGDIDIPVERKHNLRKHRRSAETADRKSLRRSLKPTAEYGGDRRELRRSLDLGKELTPQDADRVHDSNRRRDNRRSRPRVSIDNSSLSSEMTVKEQLEERKARLRVPDRDGSSREDTSAGTTDFSASENSSTKIPWRRGRIRQASAPGDIIANALPQPNELRPVPANKPESSQGAGELQQVLAERRRRRREMRQEKEVEDAPTVEGRVSQAGKANQEEISLKAKLRPVSAKLRNTPDKEPAQPKNPPKKGSGFASLMSKFSSGNDKQKVPSKGLDQAGGLAQVKGQSSHDKRKGSEVKTEDEEQTITMKLPAADKVAAAKEQKVDNAQEEVRNLLTEGNLEDIKEEFEDAVSEEAIERLRRGGLRYDPYTYASSETGTTATPIHPSSSMSSLAGYDTVSVTTDGGDADRESMIVSDSEGYLTLPEEDADNHTPQGITEDEVSSVKPAHSNIVSSSEVSMTSLKSNDGENSIKRRDNGSRNKRQEEEDEDDIMMLLSVGLAPPDDFQKHQGRDQDEVSWLSEEDDTRCSSSLDGTYTGADEQQPKVLADDENASKVTSVTKTPSSVKGNFNFKFAQLPNTMTPGPTKKVKPSDENDDDLMALLSQGLPGPEGRDDDESSLGSDTEEGVSEIGSLDGITDASFVQTFYDSPAKPGYDNDISNTNRLAKTTFVKTDGLKNLQEPEPVQKTKQKLDTGQKTKMNHKKDDENELMALLSGGLPSEESSTSKNSVMDRAPKEVQNGEESRVPKIKLNEVKGDNLSTKLDKDMRQVKSFKQDDGDVAKVGKGLKPPLVAKKQEDKKIIEKSKKDASSKRKQEEDDEDVLSLLSQGFAPVIPEPEKPSSQRHIPQNESKEGKTDLGRGGRKRPEVNKEDDVLAMLSQGIPATPDEEEEGNRNQNTYQTFQPRFRVASMDDTNQDVQSPNWRKDNDKPKFVIRNTYHDPPVRPFSSKKGDSEKPSGSSWSALSNDKGFSPYKTFTPSALLYGDDAASKWLSRANPKPIQIPLGNQSLRHFDRPKKSTQSEASSVTPGENDVKPSGSTEESVRSSEPNNVPTRQDTSPIRQDTSPIRQDTSPIRQDTSPARQPTYDALSRTRPGSDTTSTSTRRKPEDDIATTPTRRKPTMEDDTTYTSRSRSRPSTDDSPSRVKPTEEDTTPLRRRHRPESIPESPSVSTSAATPTNTTTPTSPSETDYITERRRRRKEREAQRAAEAAAAEAAEKQTATLPRNFKPADITPPLTTTEYVSHRRRRTREDVPEETVSTNITSKPAEVSSPVENGDVSSSSSRRRRRQSKGDKTPTETFTVVLPRQRTNRKHYEGKEAEPEDIQELMAPDYLSGGIAARRKLRQEQREREQLEKERLEKEQREKELAEKAKDERKDIIKRPVPIIREPTPSTSEEQDEKDKQGQRLSSPASRSKVVGMSNGDSSEAISPQISRTASPERDEVFAKTPKPSSETNHVEPSSKKTEPAKDISDKLSKEKEEAVKLTVDTTTKPEEDKVKGNEPPMSAGLSNNKRYQLAMMYSNRTSQDEATVSSPTRKVSTSLQSNETISDRIDQLRNGPVKDEDGDKESPKTPKEIEVTPGKVQAVQEKLQSPGPLSGEKEKFAGPMGDKSGAIGLAKHGLKSVNIPMKQPAVPVNKPETAEEREDAQWEEILRQNNRELRVHNWDFTDLTNQDDQNVFLIKSLTEIEGVVPAPPPLPMGGGMPPPPPAPPMMPPGHYGTLPPPPPPLSGTSINDGYNTYPPKKKKTVRLFWKETRLDRLAMYGKKDPKETIWGVLGDVTIDKRKLEHLFESKAKEILQKKILEAGKKHVISVLDPKRSNHINIALTALPHPSTIKQAIMKMDGTAVNKEGIEKLLTMVPSEEESNLIKEAMILNPDIPLGSAEQFLYMLSNITVLKARLSLWLFKMDYESMEEEVAEPLAELKKGIEDLKTNETFRHILSMLLAVGNFLNGAQIQGFHIDYLAKVPDIKDTVHKQSLLYHLCTMVIEQFPESSDLFSELASISRCAKVDFEVLETNLQKMEEQCTSSWEHLRVISKHDSHSPLKNRLQDFLSDCAQRIIVLKIVHRRVMNRFNQLLLYLGMTASSARETKKTEFCKIISEFALEYRTTRERVLEQEKKKANHRKRAMTRGKMITENLTLSQDKEEDAKLKALLKNHVGTAPGSETLKTRTRQKPTLARQGGLEVDSEVATSSDNLGVESQTDNDDTDAGHSATTANMEDVGDEQTDEMLQILVNTAKNTKTRNTPRERKRGRTNRKSLRRTLKGGTGLTEAESRALGLHPACKTGVQV